MKVVFRKNDLFYCAFLEVVLVLGLGSWEGRDEVCSFWDILCYVERWWELGYLLDIRFCSRCFIWSDFLIFIIRLWDLGVVFLFDVEEIGIYNG